MQAMVQTCLFGKMSFFKTSFCLMKKASYWTNKNANSIHSTLFTTDPEYYIFMKPVQ